MQHAWRTSLGTAFVGSGLYRLSLGLCQRGKINATRGPSSRAPPTFWRARRFMTMTALTSPVEVSRIHNLTPHPLPSSASDCVGKAEHGEEPFVLYWMQTSVRSKHSPALEHAAAIARHLKVPLRAAFTFDVAALDGRPLPERHAYFLLEALADAQRSLRENRGVTLAVIAPGNPPEISVPALAKYAVAVVTDTSYLRPGIERRLRVAKVLASRKIPFCAVEGDIVVPVEEVTDKAEHAARTIRPKITGKLGTYLKPLNPVELSSDFQPPISGTRRWVSSAGLETLDVRDIEAAFASLDGIDHGAPRVPSVLFQGGEAAAQETLADFLSSRLDKYAEGRNEPALGLQSDLSPHLRIGAISPVDVALQTRAYAAKHPTKGVKAGVESFLEELIVRRELGANMCWFGRDGYDVYEKTVPEYAKESLALHKADRRAVLHSYEELEAALTSDTYWNTMQLELIVTGKMHGYARMYWCKQIIGWTPDAETALDYSMRLNNRWELDAVDPNSYAGVIWCFGRHDQGWKERAIWGKVRYMNDAGLKRKFNMAAYISKVANLVKKHGLPPHIESLRAAKGKQLRSQATISDMLSSSRKAKSRSGSGAPAEKRRRK